MGTSLTYISLALTLVVVLALVVYLLGIIAALRGANRNLAQLAAGLDAITRDTAPLGERMATINGALAQLGAGLGAVDEDLAAAAGLFRIGNDGR